MASPGNHRRQRRRGCRGRDPQYLTCRGRPVVTTPNILTSALFFSLQRNKLALVKFIIQLQSMRHMNLKNNTPRIHHISPF